MTDNTPRDLNVLLALGTYQGMTDEEIASIVEWTAEQAAAAARAEALKEHTDDLGARTTAANLDALRVSLETLAALVGTPPVLEEVSAE